MTSKDAIDKPVEPSYSELFGKIEKPKDAVKPGGWDGAVLKFMLGAQECWAARAERPQEKPLLEMVERVSKRMGIEKPPEVLLYTSNHPNAVSLPTRRVAFEAGLAGRLPPGQLEAIIGHELEHHKHKTRDSLSTFGGLFAFDLAHRHIIAPRVERMIERIPMETTMQASGRLGARIMQLVAPFFAAVGLVNLYQQSCEYEADKGGAKATSPKQMAGALETLSSYAKENGQKEYEKRRAGLSDTQKVVEDTIEKFEPRWMRRIRHNPLEVLGSHPPTEYRLEVLRGMEAQAEETEKQLVARR